MSGRITWVVYLARTEWHRATFWGEYESEKVAEQVADNLRLAYRGGYVTIGYYVS